MTSHGNREPWGFKVSRSNRFSLCLCVSVVNSVLALPAYNALVMIAKDLLEILVCPACKQPLEYREKPESLKCTLCRRVYPVKDDIPIMLVDQATIEG